MLSEALLYIGFLNHSEAFASATRDRGPMIYTVCQCKQSLLCNTFLCNHLCPHFDSNSRNAACVCMYV